MGGKERRGLGGKERGRRARRNQKERGWRVGRLRRREKKLLMKELRIE